jgi:UDP-N-acetylmuramate--alanine ligase
VEIMATLRAARTGWQRRIVVVFQPHRYSRTKALFKEFLSAFNDADVLILTEIYAAGEDRIEGVEARALYEGIREHGHKDVTFLENKRKIVDHLLKTLQPGDMVITLGAGDIWQVSDELAKRL